MVTSQHEAAHKIFQERPELLTPVFGVLNIPLPAKTSVEVLTVFNGRRTRRSRDTAGTARDNGGTNGVRTVRTSGRFADPSPP